jgi:hypothetical protein
VLDPLGLFAALAGLVHLSLAVPHDPDRGQEGNETDDQEKGVVRAVAWGLGHGSASEGDASVAE